MRWLHKLQNKTDKGQAIAPLFIRGDKHEQIKRIYKWF